MKNFKRSTIFVILFLVICMAFTTVAFASAEVSEGSEVAVSGKLDKDMSGADMSFGERLEYALQGTVTGLVMVFAVLGLLFGIISLSKVVFYDIPEKKKKNKQKAQSAYVAPTPAPAAEVRESNNTQDDGELVAVITAAIAAMIESGDYKDEFKGGFRVVSFKRSAQSAWNRK